MVDQVACMDHWQDIVDTQRHPIEDLDSYAVRCRSELQKNSILILERFLTKKALVELQREARSLHHKAFYCSRNHNVLLTKKNTQWEDDHPCNIEVMSDKELLQFECVLPSGEIWELMDQSGNVTLCSGVQFLELNSYSESFVLRKSGSSILPHTLSLLPAFPNPFNPVTTIRFDLPEQAFVTLTIYDMLGKKIIQLMNTTKEAGFKSIQWDATDSMDRPVSAGVYFYQIQAGEFVQTRKIVLLK